MSVVQISPQKEEFISIYEGDTVNLHELLFTENRDYLVKYNNDEKIKAEELAGKVIVLLFIRLTRDLCREVKENITFLTDVYNDLHPKGGFEVIFVAIDDYRDVIEEIVFHSRVGPKYFEKIFSGMPWCAIPFSDITSRKCLERRFCVNGYYSTTSFVVDSNGNVLHCYALYTFKDYGALGYPFSGQRIQFLDSKEDEVVNKPSLQTLLASPERDYLISNKGDKVPIHTLEDKVVALYFYEAGVTDDDLTVKLEMAYKELAKKNEKFEVVLLYLSDTHSTFESTNIESFWEKFKTMPWLALPFKDPNHMKLKWVFCYLSDIGKYDKVPTIVILGADGQFIDPCCTDIVMDTVMDFELAALYPFTHKKLAKLLTEKIKELKLEMLWDENTLFRRKDGSQIRLSQLAGKRVLTIFEEHKFFRRLDILALGDSYLDRKGTNDEFEVIHVSSCKTVFDYDQPWMVHYFSDGYSLPNSLLHFVFGFNHRPGKITGTSFLAFERDGSLVRRRLYPTFKDIDEPFRTGCLEKDTWLQLNSEYHWDYWAFDKIYAERY